MDKKLYRGKVKKEILRMIKEITDNRTAKINRRKELDKKFKLCPICPVRDGENQRNRRKHGAKKPKYKNKR